MVLTSVMVGTAPWEKGLTDRAEHPQRAYGTEDAAEQLSLFLFFLLGPTLN